MRRKNKVITKMMVDTKGNYKKAMSSLLLKPTAHYRRCDCMAVESYTAIGVEIKNNGGMKASLTDKSNLAHVTSDLLLALHEGEPFVDNGAGGNPQFIRAAIHTNATGYVPGDEITIAKATAGTDNNVVLVVK